MNKNVETSAIYTKKGEKRTSIHIEILQNFYFSNLIFIILYNIEAYI